MSATQLVLLATVPEQVLAAFHRPPDLFSTNTVSTLWNDPHISERMLQAHVDAEAGRASARATEIAAVVALIDAATPLNRRSVCDLGCGPVCMPVCLQLAAHRSPE